jgi:hypothetical protein
VQHLLPMSYQQGCLRSTRSRSTSWTRISLASAQRQPLLKSIQDKLRMTCALQIYSSIHSGEGKTLKQQHDVMFQFYHGVKNTKPSQILMLCQGVSPYSDLYETTTQ